MSRFKISLFITSGLAVIYVAQLATSFPLIRMGCVLLLLACIVALGVDALLDKAKAEAQGIEVTIALAPHMGALALFCFLILVGIYIGG